MYQEYENGAYNLYVIPTNRFKRNTFLFSFKKEVKKEEISFLNFLMNVLFEGSKKYPTARLLKIACDNLYAVSWSWNVHISGNYLVCDISFQFLDEKYTEEGMLKETLLLIKELLFEPNVENGCFKEEVMELVLNRVLEILETEKENKQRYAKQRILELVGKNTPISYSTNGYKEDFLMIHSKNLYQYYQEFLRTFDLNIFVCGNGNIDWKEEIKEFIPINTWKKKKNMPYEITHTSYRKHVQTVVEKDNNNQSKLFVGCKVEPLTLFERQYVVFIYSYMLGGGSDSYLFQNVREKHSLCYSISSGFLLLSHLMLIQAGIDSKNFKRTVKLIQEEMKRIEKGDFSEEKIKSAMTIFEEAAYELTDSVAGLINNVYYHVAFGYDLVETQKENILKVTKEDIMKLAKKIHIDTIYLLEGE